MSRTQALSAPFMGSKHDGVKFSSRRNLFQHKTLMESPKRHHWRESSAGCRDWRRVTRKRQRCKIIKVSSDWQNRTLLVQGRSSRISTIIFSNFVKCRPASTCVSGHCRLQECRKLKKAGVAIWC